MLVAKQTADLITFSRALMGFVLAWLGYRGDASTLPLAVWIMIADWAGDSIDGPIARRSRVYYHSWIGDHDLLVDMFVSAGLLVYLLGTGFITPLIAGIYVIAWVLIFWQLGVQPALGMLFQAPIYGLFIWAALTNAFPVGIWMIVWIGIAIIVTWPKFPKMIVPGFIDGMRHALRK